ncbi:MAG TPA: metallopeptidase TldD-related protein [Candidatus Limnocylindrales bacterium]|nr:metallopeptidase TldD-related protein [Candidatus Limnocylindrales bacterium]
MTEVAARGEELLPLAERLLGLAAAAGATEAEVLAMGDDSALTRFANSEIHQNVAEQNLQLSLRFVDGRRVGVVSSNRTDDDALRDLADRAAAVARNSAELEGWAGLPERTSIAPIDAAYSPSTAGASPELRAEQARAVIAAADESDVVAYGSFATGTESIAVANSKGIRAAQVRTTSQLITVSMDPDGGSGYAESAAVDASTIDGAALGREASAKAKASSHAVAVEPGDYPVVLEEYAVVDILDMLGYLGFSALAVEEGRSFAEPGRRIGAESVSIWDDGRDPSGLPMAFDYEGVAKERVSLVESGVCRDVVYDAQTAGRAGRRSTGHGLPAPNPYGPFPINMFMAAGSASRDELLGGLGRGLLVTRFHYTNPVHPKLAIITGMTRDGTFLVEDGKIVAPVRNLRYTQSYLDALAGVEAIGRDRKTLRGFLGGAVVPALRIAAWTFTGATEH